MLIVLLIGFGAFLYRGVKERPVAQMPVHVGAQQACTQEAKVCPDGTNVGRTGPNCAFAACPDPASAGLGITYAVPSGFAENPAALGSDPALRIAYQSAGTSTPPDVIAIYRFPIPAGKTANSVILANTAHESSGIQAKSMSEFLPVPIKGKTFQVITVERFEAVVHTEYYLVRTDDVLRFDVLEHNVMNWSDPKLLVANLPVHQALLKMLSTLQVTTP
ncbi:MAG: hypothetical protein JWL88_202 [Parcubacteria group bacterium]|nr:hypothetical protein [Parcubacteria group bacterium]